MEKKLQSSFPLGSGGVVYLGAAVLFFFVGFRYGTAGAAARGRKRVFVKIQSSINIRDCEFNKT